MTALTKARREELRTLASNATEGPWEQEDDKVLRMVTPEFADYHTQCWSVGSVEQSCANAGYLASVSPDVVLGLLDESERLSKATWLLRCVLSDVREAPGGTVDVCHEAEIDDFLIGVETVNYPEIPEGSLATTAEITPATLAEPNAALTIALGKLRHLYDHMGNSRVDDTRKAAKGLLGPAIEAIERAVGR